MFMSKFHGRRLTLKDFKDALFQFFHSGHRLRRELLSPVLRRLRDMQAALEACESYRFYSSSLLIIYDGASLQERGRLQPEDGLSEGEEEEEEAETEPDIEEEEAEAVADAAHGSSTPANDSGGGDSGGPSASQTLSDPMVDVRMIDFAHTTCRHFQGDSVVYEGLDSGYLFGLQNLITIISELENRSTE